uniref:Uncharacterized protein n=1 Tax=Picea sitchensis TaxID=3332 RepID=A0A6B9XY51_PICSI|nr:hypothetical protein Q903MT_gene6953 [Picea sitchensis]
MMNSYLFPSNCNAALAGKVQNFMSRILVRLGRSMNLGLVRLQSVST